ncbi:GL22712 [Drosophila persimilis]|uniref:GL22712 n=1 Tax=Drosophila persimilis TaxID=7234 RepID=B4HA32_DROPE|nr:GL22712 [Drosophila persimilis]
MTRSLNKLMGSKAEVTASSRSLLAISGQPFDIIIAHSIDAIEIDSAEGVASAAPVNKDCVSASCRHDGQRLPGGSKNEIY